LFQDLGVCWLLFVVYLAILPNGILNPSFLAVGKFWAYLFLTASFGFLSLAWIVYMAALRTTRAVLINGGFSGVVTQIEFMLAAHLSAADMMIHAALWLLAAAWLLKMAYARWREAEFS
jgi:hypothetical protein